MDKHESAVGRALIAQKVNATGAKFLTQRFHAGSPAPRDASWISTGVKC
ncbi:hypothetical protein FHS20_003644 [Phyllobacterium endophyticum]|nr:hypothetical protein [Phyllobacterium endophyticum]